MGLDKTNTKANSIFQNNLENLKRIVTIFFYIPSNSIQLCPKKSE